MQEKRPSWDEYFMKIALLVAERSTCHRHHMGAIIVQRKRILTTGYNGAVSGAKDCLELGCLKNQMNIPSGQGHDLCRAIHAEQNAVVQAGLHGTTIDGATMYCTHTPCINCARIIVNSGIKRLVTYKAYPDDTAKELLKQAGVELVMVNKPETEITVLE